MLHNILKNSKLQHTSVTGCAQARKLDFSLTISNLLKTFLQCLKVSKTYIISGSLCVPTKFLKCPQGVQVPPGLEPLA